MEHDNNLLQAMDRLDRDGFWAESARVDDRYNVCGFTALATLLETLPPCRPRVLDYMLYRERATSSAVSFMAAMFTGED